jgi:hypothetical protein
LVWIIAGRSSRYGPTLSGHAGIAAQGVSLIYSPTVARHSAVHLANLDLNLLVVLRELLRERNVTRAAARLGVSQPAASAALARLRRHFGDELLVRSGNGYVLSALAVQLADPVEAVCTGAERLFGTGHDFDPGASAREFTLFMADYTIEVLGSRLSSCTSGWCGRRSRATSRTRSA